MSAGNSRSAADEPSQPASHADEDYRYSLHLPGFATDTPRTSAQKSRRPYHKSSDDTSDYSAFSHSPTPTDRRRNGRYDRVAAAKRAQHHHADDDSGLTDVIAPAPIPRYDDSGEWQRHETLEEAEHAKEARHHGDSSSSASFPGTERRNGPKRWADDRENEAGLTDVIAPAPIQAKDLSGDWQRDETLEEAESFEEADRSSQQPSRLVTELYTVSYLIFFAIWGVLARLGVQWLTYYPGAPVTISNLWANFGGSLLMGFVSEDQMLFRQDRAHAPSVSHRPRPLHDPEKGRPSRDDVRAAQSKVKKTIPLFIGLTTGFCGSFTSFSTFMRDLFYAVSNDLPNPNSQAANDVDAAVVADLATRHNGGYTFEAVLAITLLTVGMSLFALKAGAQLAIWLEPVMPTLSYRVMRRYVDPLIVVLGFGCWLGAVFMTIWPPDRAGGPAASSSGSEEWRGVALLAIVFGPVGCLARYYLSLKLNPIAPWFPLGTYTVNMFGTAVLCMCFDIQHARVDSVKFMGNYIGCQVLQGIEDGFCGALTTVSTWINEVSTLKPRHGWTYALLSILSGLGLAVIILGSVAWTVGFAGPSCLTGRQ